MDDFLLTTRKMVLTTEELENKHLRLMTSLGLYGTVWEDIDPDFLLLAFTHRSGVNQIPYETVDRQEELYLATDYEWHEFIGDAVLEMIVTTIMTELGEIQFLRNAHLFRQEIVRNLTLYCYMARRGLCREMIVDRRTNYEFKMCADMFEAIIGVLYWWLYYAKGMGYVALDHVRHWLVQNWFLHETLENLITKGSTQCGVDEKGLTPFGEWTGCGSGEVNETRTSTCLDPMNCKNDVVETKRCPVVSTLKPTAQPFRPKTSGNIASLMGTSIQPSVKSTRSRDNRFMTSLQFQQLSDNRKMNQANIEINELLKNPIVRGRDRQSLLSIKGNLNTGTATPEAVKKRVEAMAVRLGVIQ